MRELERQARFEALTERLGAWLQPCSYAAGEAVVARGEKQAGMQFVIDGLATVHTGLAETPMQECGPGDALAPQAAFGPHLAEISVTAQQACRTLLMTSSALRSLERDDAALTVELDRYLIETILENRATPLPAHDGRS